eukprot:9634081-Alexandrium_andersonii.AAC.1
MAKRKSSPAGASAGASASASAGASACASASASPPADHPVARQTLLVPSSAAVGSSPDPAPRGPILEAA